MPCFQSVISGQEGSGPWLVKYDVAAAAVVLVWFLTTLASNRIERSINTSISTNVYWIFCIVPDTDPKNPCSH